MSEYQYYEFQAVDRPLTRQQISELREYSSRAQITPTRFVNSYNWGSFKGNTNQWMERYFDAHLYFANWGNRVVMLRIPERLIDEEVLEELLVSLIEGNDPGLATHLFQRVAKERTCVTKGEAPLRRTAGDIRARAEIMTETRKREEAERQAREKARREREEAERRRKYLQSLVGREEDLWTKVDRLIAMKQPGRYDEAVSLLRDLRDLAEATATGIDFRGRITDLCNRNSKKPALLERLRKAKFF